MEDLIMLNKPENLPDGLVSCEVCLMEIPRSVARSQEGSDYVLYFCGNKCFAEWQKGQPGAGMTDNQPGR
jgi:hypothetical protein